MTEELIRLVEDIFTHSKSGLLMATVRVKQAPTPALPTGEEMLDFILLFNQGQLAEVRVKTLSGAEALAKMTGITALVGSRWTQTNAASVSMSNTALSTGQLLIQLGATQLKAAAPSASAKPSFATDPAAALVAHTRGVFVRLILKAFLPPVAQNSSRWWASKVPARCSRLKSWILDLGSWILGLGSWVLGLGSWVLDIQNIRYFIDSCLRNKYVG
jgi:hypothetical protein